MKRFAIAWLAAVLLPLCAFAEDFTLQDRKIMQGMDQSWRQGYEPTVSDGRVSVCLPLTSEKSGGKITAALALRDPDVSPFATEELSADFWKNEGLFAVRLRLPLVSGRHSGDYAASVIVTGKDVEGNPLRGEYPVVIRVRDGKKDPIRPALSGVSANLVVGEEGAVVAILTNTSRYAEMQDIELALNDPTGDILPAASDRLPLGSLMPGQSTSVRYPVRVKPDAAAALRALSFSLSYTALDEPVSWTENYTLSVTQAMRLEQGGAQVPSSVIQGDAAAITLPLMNMGRGELRNVMATLVMPGVTERQSVLVGTIEPGETKQARLSATPGKDALGEVSGEIAVTAEDDWGNETSFTLPVSLTVEKAPEKQPEIQTAADYVKAAVPGYVWPLAGGCLLLLIALIAQGALLRGKIRRLEEDKL